MKRRRIAGIIGGTLVCALLVATFLWLGRWQWRSAFAHEQRASGVVSSIVTVLDDVSTPEHWLARSSIGARVRVQGRAENQYSFVTGPRPTTAGERPWRITPVRLADNSVIAVAEPATASPLRGVVMIQGRIQPSEDAPVDGVWRPANPELTTPALLDRWPFSVLRDGYVVVIPATTGDEAVAPRFTSAPSGSIGWRNIAYAGQWWTFAIFVLFVWWRQLTDRGPESELA